uniref:Uncharacterized protein n=1 Tax=Zea mays TaxID=4577 RepID=A0A804NDK5_MAIZE
MLKKCSLAKVSSFLPTAVPLLQNTVKQKSFIGSSHLGSHAVLEYQFLPEQPSDAYERGSQLRFYDALAEVLNSRLRLLGRLRLMKRELKRSLRVEKQGLLNRKKEEQM